VAPNGGVAPAGRRRAVGGRAVDWWLVAGGLAALAAVLTWYARLVGSRQGILAFPVDLNVYRDAGLILRHVQPFYNPARSSPLYDWPGPPGFAGLKFIYPPFAALPFAVMSQLSLHALAWAFLVADLLAVPSIIWIILGALGLPRGPRRVGLTLLATAAALMTEPVQRTIYLGQVEILLVLLIVWDLCQPARRWWKGAGVGLAAGIKLVPLIFIPYLLLTRRFRQAAVAAGAFAATVVIGYVALPRDSSRWWLHGLFLRGSYAGNARYAGNQSLQAIMARTGSAAWHAEWLAAAAVTAVLGLAAAAVLDRAGHRVLGLATCALTGLLISPLSWDHHWAWIVLVAPVLAFYALRASGLGRWAWIGLGVLVTAIFWAWPTRLWGETTDPFGWIRGIIWAPPSGNNTELGWHGSQLIVGNAYVLTGIALLMLLVVAALTRYRSSRRVTPALDHRAEDRSQPRSPALEP
jgi:alpha-1,2-mannosyltransferase